MNPQQHTTMLTHVPSKQQVKAATKANPQLKRQDEVRGIVQHSLQQLSAIECRLDRLENQGLIGRVWGSITGSTQREMVSLMRALTQSQQTTIKLVLTLAIYHAENVAVMDEILDELGKAKGVHTRTASHIEFLYEQVEILRDVQISGKQQPATLIRKLLLPAAMVAGLLALVYPFFYP